MLYRETDCTLSPSEIWKALISIYKLDAWRIQEMKEIFEKLCQKSYFQKSRKVNRRDTGRLFDIGSKEYETRLWKSPFNSFCIDSLDYRHLIGHCILGGLFKWFLLIWYKTIKFSSLQPFESILLDSLLCFYIGSCSNLDLSDLLFWLNEKRPVLLFKIFCYPILACQIIE